MAEPTSPAALAWTAIVRRSAELKGRLVEEGATVECVAAVEQLLDDGARSGELTPQPPWRDRLDGILGYWAAALRLYTDELVLTPELKDPSTVSYLPKVEPDEFLRRAVAPGGIAGHEVARLRVEGTPEAPRELRNVDIFNSRLVDSELRFVKLHGNATWELASLFDCSLVDVRAHDLRANGVRMRRVSLGLDMSGRLDLTDAALRRVVLQRCTAREALFVNADFGAYDRPELEAFAQAYQLPEDDADAHPGVVFERCSFAQCDFRGSTLHGAHFNGCTFEQSASFANADLRGAVFRECSFGRADAGDFTTSTGVESARFDDRSLVNASFADGIRPVTV